MMMLGTLIGTFAGIIPGLSSGMSVALFLPLTFTMTPLHGIIFLISIYVSVGYGGALTAILLNTPGSPQNAVTTLDGFELTKQGRAAEALGYSISSSVYGGLISYVAMLLSIGFVATVALKFGPSGNVPGGDRRRHRARRGRHCVGCEDHRVGRLRPADRHDRHRARRASGAPPTASHISPRACRSFPC